MYVKFGDAVKQSEKILGIFDIDNASYSKITQEFLKRAEKENRLQNLSSDIPSSFILSTDSQVIFTRAASKSCKKR